MKKIVLILLLLAGLISPDMVKGQSVATGDTVRSATNDSAANKTPTAISNINAPENNIVLYPNPTRNELNVIYNANADIKNIAVYNIIGKVLLVYKVTGDSANMNLENIPEGIYFVRLTNSHGDVVATKKFTKQ